MNKIDSDIIDLGRIVKEKRYDIDPVKFRELIGRILTSKRKNELEAYLNEFVVNSNDNFYKSQLAIFILSIYEKFVEDKSMAVGIAKKMLSRDTKPNYPLCSLFRLCKMINDYKEIDELLVRKPELLNIETFDVLYEMTFYYSAKNEFEKIDHIIGKLIKQYNNNKPVMNTAKVLALKYGLLNKYENDFLKKTEIDLTNKPENLIYEQTLDNLFDKTLSSIALADLTNGIAHEFGQPVTNIRYGIQYYSQIFREQKDEFVNKKLVLDSFNDILRQTERIGKLIDRLDPITSSKTHISTFNLIEAINDIFKQEWFKLSNLNINYLINPLKSNHLITFDRVQFNQIFTNLLVNSMDSIEEKLTEATNYQGEVNVNVNEYENDYYLIEFIDNGCGIAEKDKARVFNPFYTTKAPGKGQGLGLFIISNLLKIGAGTIKLINNYEDGTKFNILIPKKHKYEL